MYTAEAITDDDGELDVAIAAEADDEEAVVEDTGRLGLADSIVGLDGDSEGLFDESRLHLAKFVGVHVQVAHATLLKTSAVNELLHREE